jgi:hypothetical protein
MDRLSQADAVLAAAVAYSSSVIVPGHALSPMDCESTIPVTRLMVAACDRRARDGGAVTAGSTGCAEDVLLPGSMHDGSVHNSTVADGSVHDGTLRRGGDPAGVVIGDPLLDAEMVRVSRVLRPATGFGRTA